MIRKHNLVARLLVDETGGEMLEYGLVMGLLFIASLTAIATLGTKLLGRWSSINSSM